MDIENNRMESLPARTPRRARAFARTEALASQCALPRAACRAGPRGAAVLAFAASLLLAACATAPGPSPEPAPPLPRSAEPPKPAINLDGFPLPYRQGYADGCASATGPERKDAQRYAGDATGAERKDAQRFAGDGNYRTGWTDGRALCARK